MLVKTIDAKMIRKCFLAGANNLDAKNWRKFSWPKRIIYHCLFKLKINKNNLILNKTQMIHD